MKANRLRQLLKQGKPTLGTCQTIPWPRVTEIIGASGAFDYLEFRSVNSTWDLEFLENFNRACDLFPDMASMIKVGPEERAFLAPKSIDAGFQNVKFGDVNTAQDVRDCLKLITTPDRGGTFGWGHRRLGVLANSSVEKWKAAIDDVCVAVVIESKQGVDNIDEILSVPGIDMISFGGRDYSISIGKFGQHSSAEVHEVERHVAQRAVSKGVPFRAHLHDATETPTAWLDMGVRHFFIQSDTGAIRDMCRIQGSAVKKTLAGIR